MGHNVFKKQIEELLKRQDIILDQIEAEDKALTLKFSDADKVVSRDIIKDLELEYNGITQKIELLRAGKISMTPEQLKTTFFSSWDERLHYVDYHIPKSNFQDLAMAVLENKVALFIIRDSYNKYADLFWRYVNPILKEQGYIVKDADPETYLLGGIKQSDFVARLKRRFGVEDHNDEQKSLNAIAQGFLAQINEDELLIFRIYASKISNTFLEWFINKFWKAIIDSPSIANKHFICVLMVNDNEENPFSTNLSEFDRERFFEIQLDNWQERDLQNWFRRPDINESLKKYGGFQDENIREFIPELIQMTYNGSNGIPRSIADTLLGSVLNILIQQIKQERG